MSDPPSVWSTIDPNYTKAGNFGRADLLGSTVNAKLAKRARADGKANDEGDRNFRGAVGDLIGNAVITPVLSRNLDMMQGYPHSTTGIPYAIQGSATMINVDVSEYLATFQDPLKVILGTSIHKEAKVIITRKYVVGGRSLITPEHAPARTVSIQEDAREVMMTRYGGDIEMNLNLFLRPEDAREELALKVGAQRRELERTLIEHGYNSIMEEGTNLVDAIIRSNPAYSTNLGTGTVEVEEAAERINISTVFGAMSKNCFPIQNLLAAAKYASAYTTTNEKGSVLLLPHGSNDVLRHTRRENMVYSVSGPDLLARNNGKKIDMTYDDAYTDPSTNVRILIHRPFPTFDGGVANPDVGMGGLTDETSFACYYPLSATNRTHIVDFHNRCWHLAGESAAANVSDVNGTLCVLRPKLTAVMSSAVLAAPGADTGELLIGYPFTSVSTSSTEIMKIQLRVYLGSVIKKPENIIIMRNVYFEGLGKGSRTGVDARDHDQETIDVCVPAGAWIAPMRFDPSTNDLCKVRFPTLYLQANNKINLRDFAKSAGDMQQRWNPNNYQANNGNALFAAAAILEAAMIRTRNNLVHAGILILSDDGGANHHDRDTFAINPEYPTIIYRGATQHKDAGVVGALPTHTNNNGHLGPLDHPSMVDRLFGTFAYSPMPNPDNSYAHTADIP